MAGTHLSTSLRTLAPFLAFVALGCQEIAGPDARFPVVPRIGDVELTEAERLTYEEDAVRLALRHGTATGAPGMNQVEPPAALVESLFNALTAVHGALHPARDTVIDVFGIRTFPATLAARFATMPGVIWAEPNGYGGDGNDIRARPENGGWRLEYSVGFGDCPAGCTGRRVWTFVADATGAVRYLGASGDPLPSWPPR
jgi:hypothetical protein